MAIVAIAPPALSGDLVLYHTTDPFLSNASILLFHGPAATVGATSARVQLHVFTIAGHASYPRLAISPGSPFYTAVTNLPRDEQGDEVCRGIAYGLKKYFEELPQEIKKALRDQVKAASALKLFSDDHIAILASRLVEVENKKEVISDLIRSYAEQKISWLDLDVVLPPGTINAPASRANSANSDDLSETQILTHQYGKYANIVAAFGELAFLPTSKLKRAPSKVTTIGRSASFLRQQKEYARKEVDELLATERSYISRLKEVERIASDVRKSTDDELRQRLDAIFPSSLTAVRRTNADFLVALEEIVFNTVESSRQELDGMTTEHPTAQQIRQDFLEDNQGIVAVAKCFCEKLPGFKECYATYLKGHASAVAQLSSIIRGDNDAAQRAILSIGEQQLTSLLIEPVQRLPRYALFIDGISKQLPARHPALKHLLKAKDLVVELCASDDTNGTIASIDEKLRSRVHSWPTDLHLTGRLIMATDYTELAPPFDLDRSFVRQGMLMLFTDSIVLLERKGSKPISARTLCTELETSIMSPNTTHEDLAYLRRLELNTATFTESHEGQSVRVVAFSSDASAVKEAESLSVLLLEGQYEGKAARLIEEIAKARVESRFSEAERESHTWEVRASESGIGELRLFTAILEDSNAEYVMARKGSSDVRIILDIDKHSRKPRAGQNGVESIITITSMRDGNYRLSIDSVFGQNTSEQVSATEISAVLRRKLALLLTIKHATDQPALSAMTVRTNRTILESLSLQLYQKNEVDQAQIAPAPAPKSQWNNPLRPLSPVKMLSSFLSSSTGPGSQPPPLRKESSAANLISAAASFNMQPNVSAAQLSSRLSRDGRPVSSQSRPKSSSSMQSFNSVKDTAHGIDGTLSAYLLAMKARKGNIVGRSLKMRFSADELAVNELYNTLLNKNQMMVIAAQAPVDILFAAFEKFLRLAWQEQRGRIMPLTLLKDMQAQAESLFRADFDRYLKGALLTLPAHNQKAFKGIINLLNELLDGTGNDADRGALTAAFTELLVPEGDSHQYIGLLDRLVDGVDTYFGEPWSETDHDAPGHALSHKRSRSVNTGSISSNTSSLRKKFGFGGLSRENSRSEHDLKGGSVWRTLSKSRSRAESPVESIGHRSHSRAHSTESESRSQSRPVSQDGAASRNLAIPDSSVPTVSPSILPGLTTIGEHPSFIPMGPPRKKRRSSLSDLKLLDTPFVTPLRPAKSPQSSAKQPAERSLPTSPIPSTPSSKGGSLRIQSPGRSNTRPALPASFRKHSPSASATLNLATKALISNDVSAPNENEAPSAASPSKARKLSNIPTLSPRNNSPSKAQAPHTPVRSGLSERRDVGNIIRNPVSPQADKLRSPIDKNVSGSPPIPKPTTGSPQKRLRMQSPQKIRERLQTERAAVVAAHSNLQDELGKIGDELTLTPSRLIPTKHQNAGQHKLHGMDQSTSSLAAKVLKMEAALPQQITALTDKLETIQTDLASSLTVSESKCKRLDELYREANAENEALYARFNGELARVLKAVRGGEGVEELRKQLQQQNEEAARLKKENGRLKREVLGLRAQLKE